MANSPNWRPTAGVSHGEQTHQMLIIDGPVLWRDKDSGDYVKLELVDDGTDSGIYVFKSTAQTADNQVPT